MAVLLEGGCRVSGMREGAPRVNGSVSIWNQIGKDTGAKAVSLSVVEFGPGLSPVLRNEESDEVLYSLDSCKVLIDEVSYKIERDSGIYLRAGQALQVENHGLKRACFVVVACPPLDSAAEDLALIARLADQRAMPTADRWYRVLIDSEVTQFVGSIPPGRAPDHFHEYEEVLFILRGEGRMWTEAKCTPIEYGSCIYLPPRQVHCVENTGAGELRLLGVFYPAGSPAVRYET